MDFRKGGYLEDMWDGILTPYIWIYGHFHDPLEPWNKAGGLYTSLILEAQDGAEGSWQKAREYYYRALTAPTEAEKEQKLSDAFRALGRVMHLVADASVPEHVRGDSHILSVHLEEGTA